MKRSDLQDLEALIMKEVVKRRHLGGYSPDAEGILLICESMMRLLQHTIENYPEVIEDDGVPETNSKAKPKPSTRPRQRTTGNRGVAK